MQFHRKSAQFLRHSFGMGLVLVGAMTSVGVVHAQAPEVLRNVVQLSASGQVEVSQDWLQMMPLRYKNNCSRWSMPPCAV